MRSQETMQLTTVCDERLQVPVTSVNFDAKISIDPIHSRKTYIQQWLRMDHTPGAGDLSREARAPTFTNGWARGAPLLEEQQTRNWPDSADHHESAHQNG